MGNPMLSVGDAEHGDRATKIFIELRRCSVVITKRDADIYTVDSHIHYHNRTSTRFVHIVSLTFTGLSTSGTEPGVTHNRRVSDALHHHRIFDTMMMSTHPLVPLHSHTHE